MHGPRPSKSSAQLARAQSLTRAAAKQAGSKVFTTAGPEAVPRSNKGEEVLDVEGTGIKFVAAMPLNPNRMTAGLSGADAEAALAMRPERAVRKL